MPVNFVTLNIYDNIFTVNFSAYKTIEYFKHLFTSFMMFVAPRDIWEIEMYSDEFRETLSPDSTGDYVPYAEDFPYNELRSFINLVGERQILRILNHLHGKGIFVRSRPIIGLLKKWK